MTVAVRGGGSYPPAGQARRGNGRMAVRRTIVRKNYSGRGQEGGWSRLMPICDQSNRSAGPAPWAQESSDQPHAARRCRRHPAATHAVAVGAARRLHCDARPGVASQNSLRSLRSLRSDSRDESVDEARCARRPQACASRRHRNRPRRVPPAARQQGGCSRRKPQPYPQRRARAGRSAPLRRREGEQGHKRSGGPLVPCERPGRKDRRGLQGQGLRPARAARFNNQLVATV